MVARVRAFVKDPSGTDYWTTTEIESAIASVLAEFSSVCPDVSSRSFNGDGTTRSFDVLSGGSPDTLFLYAIAVESPIDADPAKYLPFADFARGVVVVRGNAPASGTSNVKIWYAKTRDIAAATWLLGVDDEPTIEVGAAAQLATSGARWAGGRINAAPGYSGVLAQLGATWGKDYRRRLDVARQRTIGPTWWTSWRVDADDV